MVSEGRSHGEGGALEDDQEPLVTPEKNRYSSTLVRRVPTLASSVFYDPVPRLVLKKESTLPTRKALLRAGSRKLPPQLPLPPRIEPLPPPQPLPPLRHGHLLIPPLLVLHWFILGRLRLGAFLVIFSRARERYPVHFSSLPARSRLGPFAPSPGMENGGFRRPRRRP